MTEKLQATIGRPFALSGAGLHSGRQSRVVVSPASAGHGLACRIRDGAASGAAEATWVHRVPSAMSTTLGLSNGRRLRTVEHMLASFAAFGEAARVLKPGGELLIGDYLTASEEAVRSFVDALADLGGFTVEHFRNASENVVRALEEDNERKQRIIASLPRFLGVPLAETLSLEGSARYRDWRAGRICYYMAVLRRPAGDGGPGRDFERHGPAREI